jgi:hypothetical protein
VVDRFPNPLYRRPEVGANGCVSYDPNGDPRRQVGMAAFSAADSIGERKAEDKTDWKASSDVVGLLVTFKEWSGVGDCNELHGYAIDGFSGAMAPICQRLTRSPSVVNA